MKDQIKTKSHRLPDVPELATFKELFDTSPLYVVENSALALMQSIDAAKVIQSMLDHIGINMPYPQLVIELEVGHFTSFVHLRTDGHNKLVSNVVFTKAGSDFAWPCPAMSMEFLGSQVLCKSLIGRDRLSEEIAIVAKDISMIASTAAIILLNTEGIEKQKCAHKRLNRARAKTGKSQIREYSYVRIGTVYDKHGNPHKFGEKGSHTKMPHFRSGYVRNQRYGKNFELSRPIFIPHCLVNFDPSGGFEEPKPKAKIIRA